MRVPAAARRDAIWRRLRGLLQQLETRGGQSAHGVQARIARRLGTSAATVSSWWRRDSLPEAETLAVLALRYGLNGDYVLTGRGPPMLAASTRPRAGATAEAEIAVHAALAEIDRVVARTRRGLQDPAPGGARGPRGTRRP